MQPIVERMRILLACCHTDVLQWVLTITTTCCYAFRVVTFTLPIALVASSKQVAAMSVIIIVILLMMTIMMILRILAMMMI